MFESTGYNFIVLTAIVVVESFALSAIVRETLWVKNLFFVENGPLDQIVTTLGSRIPKFTAKYLGGTGTLSHRTLLGKSTMLLIVEATTCFQYHVFQTILRALLSKVDGNVYVICSGTEKQCQRFFERNQVYQHWKEWIHFVIDANNELTSYFDCENSPLAIHVDQNGIVRKLGSQLLDSDVTQTNVT